MSFAILLSTLISTATFGAPPPPEATAPTPTAPIAYEGQAGRALVTGEQTPTSADAARYAELEQKTPQKVTEFRGGSAVIYVSTGAAIVLIVLLILLI